MSCYRFDLQRKYIPYLNGVLKQSSVQRIERHIARCKDCGTRMDRLKETVRLLSQIPAQVAPDIWPAIEASVNQQMPFIATRHHPWRRIAVAIVFGMLSAVIGAFGYAKLADHPFFLEAENEVKEYKTVPISLMSSNTEPHVATMGYVTEIRKDPEEGDMVFKLVEDLNSTHPFVMCEILDPNNIRAPEVGSYVRVYGVSRFDNKSNHLWQEVHPVFDIEVVKKNNAVCKK